MKRCARTAPLSTSLAPVLSYTDVLPGVYEGGFKVWECSIDLCRYLHATPTLCGPGRRVLELGCGHGLPGSLALRTGASHVLFQDLNEDVLRHSTMATVQANCGKLPAAAEFWAGDWSCLASRLAAAHPDPFHLMLSAETIYNPATYRTLCELVDTHLAPDGVALFAAKRFYFGVGGSTDAFSAAVTVHAPGLRCDVVAVYEDGGSNIREIVALSRTPVPAQ